jgi:hypothetical protein
METSEPEKSLQDRVKEWLVNEGYPIEFRTAREFLKHGFTVRQGHYVKSPEKACVKWTSSPTTRQGNCGLTT